MQDKGLLPRGTCSIVNSHGDQVHVNESFVMWFNTVTLKQIIAHFCFSAVPLGSSTPSYCGRWRDYPAASGDALQVIAAQCYS